MALQESDRYAVMSGEEVRFGAVACKIEFRPAVEQGTPVFPIPLLASFRSDAVLRAGLHVCRGVACAFERMHGGRAGTCGGVPVGWRAFERVGCKLFCAPGVLLTCED